MRFLPSVALTVGAVLGLFAFDAALAGIGPFQGTSVEDRMVALNVFMSVSIGTGLFLAAASANERRFEAEQALLIAKLQSADAQVSRLEEFVTFCAWSGRVRWKEEWVSVETFLSERYNLNISHGISDEAMRTIAGRCRRAYAAAERNSRQPSGHKPRRDGVWNARVHVIAPPGVAGLEVAPA